MTTRSRADTRRALLLAAAQVVRAEGAAGLTLEAVARAAGVSKGGLLYHFPTKDALIEGMIADLLERFEADVEAAMRGDDAPDPGRWLRAFVRVSFATPPPDLDLTAGLFAAAATNPALLAPMHAAFARWQRRAEADGLDPALATLVRLATDGLWFADLFGAAPPSGAARERVQDALLRLTREPAP